MGLKAGRQAMAFQYIVPLAGRVEAAEVYFDPAFRGGYGWLFPSRETARLGVAVTPGADGPACLRLLWERLQRRGIILDSPLRYTVGSVPVGGPQTLIAGNMLLVGDAAGHTHPVTGAGILNAIIAGELAGRAAARAALEDDMRPLVEYEEEVRLVLGPALERAARRRAYLEARWNGSRGELSAAIRRSWVAFPEYYEGD
jgi:flavin-dependent dehydrogenase